MTQLSVPAKNDSKNVDPPALSHDELSGLLKRYRKELATVRNERDKALRAFGDSQKQLSATQVRAQIGTWDRWIDSDVVYLSDQSFRIMGYNPGEVEPTLEFIRQLIHPDDRDRVMKTFSESEIWNRGETFVFRICRRDGECRTIRIEYVMTEDLSGRPWRMVGVVQDITEKLTPTTEAAAPAFIEATIQYCPFILAYCDLDGTVQFANRALLEEVPSVEIGHPIFEYTTDKTEAVRTVMERVRATQRPLSFQFNNVSQAGEHRTFDAWIGPVLQDTIVEGYVLSILGPFGRDRYDSTGLSLETNLVSHAHRLASVGYWERNLETLTHQWSPEIYRIIGVDMETIDSDLDTLFDMMVPEDRSKVDKVMADIAEGMTQFDIEYRLVQPEGKIINIRSRGEVVINTRGEKTIIGTVQDVTDQMSVMNTLRDAELKYRALYEEMSRTHEDLIRMTRRLSTVQEEERRRISLELHDDVGGLLSALQIMLHIQEDARSDASGSFQRFSTIVDDIIERVDQLTRQLRPSSLDRLGLESALRSHFGEYETMYDLSVDVSITLDDEDMISEEVKIATYRIVQEALTNVAKHAKTSTARVQLKQNKRAVELLVEDDGCGMSGPQLDLASLGIGLDGMRERATLLGGTIEIDSAPEKGTRIEVSFPI